MSTLLVVRHGQAEGNADHRFIGQSPARLTETGKAQAESVARRLSELPITRIVSSDLVRCVETAEPLAHAAGVEVEHRPELREIDNGEWTGLLPAEIQGRWPDLWHDYANGVDVARPGGETWRQVANRVVPVAEELLAADGVTVISTHSGPTLILAMWASGIEVEGNIFSGRFGALHNCSVTVLVPGPRLISYNDVGHLATLPDQRLPFSPVIPS
ncbi:MAG TPA: histidine phosphatase family protein [Acidimicrobiia bacterium]|nr:histidine phosphatase family protein [Acidimicrobiia bacterium]